MKFEIKKNILTKALLLTNKTLLNDDLNQSFNSLLFDVKENEISISNYNNNFASLIKINQVKIYSEGIFLIKGKILIDIVNNLNNDLILFEIIDNSILSIKTNDFTSQLNLLNSDLFSKLDFEYKDWVNIKLNKNFINNLSEKISFFTFSNNITNNILNGVLIDSTRLKNKIEAIATNSYYLGYIQDEYIGENFKIIIDVKTIKFIKVINDISKNENVFYTNGKKLLIKDNDNNLFMCKLLEGEYPSVYKVLEETYPYNFSIKKNLLNNSLNVSSVITQSDNSPKLEIIINKNQINLIAKSNEFGISNEKIPVEFSNDINQIKFILNLKYLNQMVKIFPDEEIIFNFISNDRQICFTSERNKKYKFLLLPIKQ